MPISSRPPSATCPKCCAKSYTNYELILVDDGSLDHTRQVLSDLLSEVECLRVFVFARRFGLEIAIACGLDNAIGDVVVVLRPECDPPDLIPEFVDQAQSCRGIVVGVRDDPFRRGRIFYKLAYELYYRVCRPSARAAADLLFDALYRADAHGAQQRPEDQELVQILACDKHVRRTSGHSPSLRASPPTDPGPPQRPCDLGRGLLFDDLLQLASPAQAGRCSRGPGWPVQYRIRGLRGPDVVVLQARPAVDGSFIWPACSCSRIVLLVLAAICEYLACVLEEVKFRPLYFLEDELQSSVMTNDKSAQRSLF